MPTTRTLRSVIPASPAKTSFATTLRIDPGLFLNHLFQFTSVRLVVRGGGFSLFRKTQFGVFHPLESPETDSRHDPVSGLTLEPSLIRRVCCLGGSDLPRTFEIEFAGIGFSLAIIPEKNRVNDEVTNALLSTFSAGSVALETIRGKGASDWLDEGFSSHGNYWRNRLAFDRESRELDIRIRSGPLAISCRMHPVLADRDRHIIRLSDTAANTVLHFDSRTSDLTARNLTLKN